MSTQNGPSTESVLALTKEGAGAAAASPPYRCFPAPSYVLETYIFDVDRSRLGLFDSRADYEESPDLTSPQDDQGIRFVIFTRRELGLMVSVIMKTTGEPEQATISKLRRCFSLKITVLASGGREPEIETLAEIRAAVNLYHPKHPHAMTLVGSRDQRYGTDLVEIEHSYVERFRQQAIAGRKLTFFYEATVLPLEKLDFPIVVDPQPEHGDLCTSLQLERMRNMIQSFDQMDHSDMCIEVAKGGQERSFFVHRVILAAASPVFTKMFEENTEETATGIIKMDDFMPASVEEFLKFIYSYHLPQLLDHNRYIELVGLSDKYQVEPLKRICEERLREDLWDEIFFDVVQAAHVYHLQALHASCVQVAAKRKGKLFRRYKTEWEKMKTKNPVLAFSILEHMAGIHDSASGEEVVELGGSD